VAPQAEGEILRNQKSFNEGSSFSGLPASRRVSIAPAAFQDSFKMKEDLKSTTVKKNQLQMECDGLRKDKEKLVKDMANLDAKYKQAAKDKSALQGEKATLEREVKRLMGQNTGLEKQMEKVKTKENKVKEERDQRLQVEKQLAALTKAHQSLQVCCLPYLFFVGLNVMFYHFLTIISD
jgi:septal ring factor EnvC (AmiA/AmiB activator)